jgi:hypothetical protein
METYALLNEEIGKPNLLVTDAMIATVINIAGVEISWKFAAYTIAIQ